MSETCCVALSTFPDVGTAKKIAHTLLEEALIACANILPAVDSIYFWQNKIEENSEALVIFKLTAARFAQFSERLRALHPYDVPEIIRLDISDGNPDYLRWIGESCARR